MKNKVRIVCYGDSNTWGYNGDTGGRFADDERWTMQLQALLGDAYMVCEEGLSGRTSVFDDPLGDGLNGKKHLMPALNTHRPLDALVLMLGTNDCKQRYCATAKNMADGVMQLVKMARQAEVWRDVPHILVVAPIVIDKRYAGSFIGGEMGEGCVEKSRALPALLREAAAQAGCAFVDSNDTVQPNLVDFMHFDSPSNARFAAAITDAVKIMLAR